MKYKIDQEKRELRPVQRMASKPVLRLKDVPARKKPVPKTDAQKELLKKVKFLKDNDGTITMAKLKTLI